MLRIIAFSTTSLLLVLMIPGGSCVAQVDLRLGSTDFFLGEKFHITAYQQQRMDELKLEEERENLRSNRIRGARLVGPIRYPTNLEERVLSGINTDPTNYFDGTEGEDPSTPQYRRGRLVGRWRLPTGLEEQVNDQDLTADWNNQVVKPKVENMREARLIGPKRYRTEMEDRFLRPVNADIDNTFDDENDSQ